MRRGSEENLDNIYLTFHNNQLLDPSKSNNTVQKKMSSKFSFRDNKKKSPIDFNVAIDTSQVVVDFQQCKSVLVNQLCMFTVDSKDPNNNSKERDVKAIITSPSGNHIVPKIVNSSESSSVWKVEYIANEIGEYYVDVFYANQLVNGSPFKSNVFDPSKIKITATLFGIVEQVVKFEVDASKAGTGQLEIAVDNGKIPCNFTSSGNLKFIPSFTPRDAGKHEVSIKFNNHEVPESPFVCNVVDINRITVLNSNETSSFLFPIYKTNFVEVSLSEEFSQHLNVKLTAPSGQQVPVSRVVTPQNTIKIGFVANEIGTHPLEIDYAGTPLNGSPFDIKIYDSSRIQVSDIQRAELNKPCEFTIDASSAGEGQLEIAINDGLIKNNVKQIKPGHYLVSFVPIKAELYTIEVKFNNELVPGCPKKCTVKDTHMPKLIGKIFETVVINEETMFSIGEVHSLSDLQIKIKSQTGQEIPPKFHKLGSEDYNVKWTPRELGSYTITVTYMENTQVKDTPLKIKVYDPKQVKVYNMQDGLVMKPNIFCVDASEAGEGSLEIGITCQGQFIANQVKPIGYSKFEVQFTPQIANTHLASINFNGRPIAGSPFQIKIVDSSLVKAHGKGLGAIPINMPTTFQVFTGALGSSSNQVKAQVSGPKGEHVPVKLILQPNGDFVGEFTPTTIGQHRIEILYAGQAVNGSPFMANAYDPHACEIKNMPKELTVNMENSFEVDLTKVGNVDYLVKVLSPTGVSLPVSYEGGALKKRVTFAPNELGPHKITMQIAGHTVSGTPLLLNCVDQKFPIVRGEGLHHGIEDKPAYFYIDPQGMKGSIEVNIEGPQHYTKNQVERQQDGTYLVKYTPVEVGLFKIFVKWNNRDVPNSPFVSYVINPEKVKVVGGWHSVLDHFNIMNLKLYEEKTVSFDASEAGPGNLTAVISAPNGTKLPFKLHNQSQIYTLTFTALFEGEYKLQMYYENHLIPNMPVVAKTVKEIDLNKIEVHGLGLHEAKINQEYEFVIDGSRAGDLHGMPEIRMAGTRCDVDVRVQQMGHNIYKCSYIAQVPGAYLLSIKWNDKQVGDSPYKVNVGMNTDPQKVVVSGEGIKMGVYGQDIKALIDTRRAGPGELTAHCMGPLKVAYCEFFDHKDGTFTLYVKPQEPGKHILQIKYNEEHVPGSPFVIRIAGPPDASKVKVFGPGICHGVLNKYESRFICETKGAGAGQLTVRIRGPKGAFRVEMQRESQKDRTIYCKFDPTEAGHYQINIKWSGVHVPGSPFNVNIFNNQEELEHFLKTNPEVAYSIQQHQHI